MKRFRTLKVKLSPTPGQFNLMSKWGEYSQEFYDCALNYIKRCRNKARNNANPIFQIPLDIMSGDSFIKELRNNEKFSCVYNDCPHSVCDGGIRKAYHDMWCFETGKLLFMPKCSRKRKGLGKLKLSFYINPRDIQFFVGAVRINKLGVIKLAERDRIPAGSKYKTPWFYYDGSDWYVTVKTPVQTYNGIDITRLKPYLPDSVSNHLISEYKRLDGLVNACERKTINSNNWIKAIRRLKAHAVRVANIALDIENKYDLDDAEGDIVKIKEEVKSLLYSFP